MPRVAWITDPHLNALDKTGLAVWHHHLRQFEADAWLISGDIAESHDFADFLKLIAEQVEGPIYYVLGNHDYYRSSIREVRRRAGLVGRRHDRLIYLSQQQVIPLSPEVGLIGHDGWGDARLGDPENSPVILNDFLLIEELALAANFDPAAVPPAEMDVGGLCRVLERLGDEAAAHIAQVLPAALEVHRKVVLLTHVPPFREATLYQNRISNNDWLPYFCCHALGEVLLDLLPRFPDQEVLVLCGHTHHAADIQPLPNLRVLVGEAEYFQPRVQQVFQW